MSNGQGADSLEVGFGTPEGYRSIIERHDGEVVSVLMQLGKELHGVLEYHRNGFIMAGDTHPYTAITGIRLSLVSEGHIRDADLV